MSKISRFFKRFYLGFILVFLYVPIIVLIVQSFNAGKSRAKWEGFSFHWYQELFKSASIMNALQVTITVAVIAMIVSTILGTLAAIGIYSMKKRQQSIMMTLTNLPNTMPDIVTGISLMLLFIFTKVDRGYFTMLLAHITFDTPYVILSVMPKLKQMNKHTYEAALDLGATPGYALLHVLIPECRQGIVTGAMLEPGDRTGVAADVLGELVPVLDIREVAAALAGDHDFAAGPGHLFQDGDGRSLACGPIGGQQAGCAASDDNYVRFRHQLDCLIQK